LNKLSKRIASAAPLATTAMHSRVETMRNNGEHVIDFSIAISHFDAPAEVRRLAADTASNYMLPYTAVPGTAALRARLAEKVQRDNGIDAQPSDIIVTNGAKQALYEALYVLTDPGDTIMVFRPYWPAYLAAAHLLALNVEIVDLPPRIDIEFLAALPVPRLVILNNPHNPTGGVLSAEELGALGTWLVDKGCLAIVDESYEKLVFEGAHCSLASITDWRNAGIVTIFSASQSYAMMGWRSGFAVAPPHVVDAMDRLQGPITAAVSALTQVATGAAFDSNESHLLRADYRTRRDIVIDMFAEVAWAEISVPQSGPYLWCDIRALKVNTIEFAEQLLAKHKVAVMPGDALGQPGFIRIGFIADDVNTLRLGVAAIIGYGCEQRDAAVHSQAG
jgi:aspartate aminotransferase